MQSGRSCTGAVCIRPERTCQATTPKWWPHGWRTTARNCAERPKAPTGAAQEAAQEPENAPEVSEDQGAGNEAQGGQEPPQEGGTEDGGMIAGHLDPKDLEDLKKADLERMANDMGLDIPKAKTKADLIAAITAAEVYAPAEDENGGAL